MAKNYWEFRGVDNLVYAEITKDDATGIEFGEVKDLTGAARISKETDSSSATHFYDNIPAIVIESQGADTIEIDTSGIPLDVLSEITGQFYEAATGLLVEQERVTKYFALGYITNKTDGTKMLVWRLKGTFGTPSTESQTIDDGTDANGQTITYTGISTTAKFTKTGKGAKASIVDTSINTTITDETWFSKVQTPDTITTSTRTSNASTSGSSGG